MRIRRLPAVLLPLALATTLAACGSSDTDKPASTPSSSSSVMSDDKMTDKAMPDDKMSDKAMSDDKMTDKAMSDDKMTPGASTDDRMAQNTSAGQYLNYSDYTAKAADYADTNVVYFFHAPWCPTCQATEKDVIAKKSSLPSGLTLVKVDYDSATDLKRKYGITAQHTFVKVDKDGSEIKKWAGTISVADIAAKAA